MELAKKTAAFAISFGFPMRSIGMRDNVAWRCCSVIASVIFVSINPGAMQLTRIFREANSLAKALVKPIIAALEAA